MKIVSMLAFSAATLVAGAVDYTVPQLRDEIKDLPGLPGDVPYKMFSGYVPITADGSKKIFYWFVEAEQKAETSPVVLWTNGGPGCSGLGGMLTEQGPFHALQDGTLEANPYAWNKVANMLFIEQPAGVGFSTAPDGMKYGDDQAAEDNYQFVVGWFKKFPQFSSVPFYASSESYGGHYMPTLARELVKQGGVPNFKGFLVGNPLTYMPYRDFGQFGTYYYHQLLPKPMFDKYMAAGCDKDDSSATCDQLMDQMGALTDGMDPYALDFPYCTDNGAAGRANRWAMTKMLKRAGQARSKKVSYFPDYYDPCSENHGEDYLNRPEVQKAIHVEGNVTWTMCADKVGENYNFTDVNAPVMDIYTDLLDSGKGLNILVYSGDDDSICATLGSQQWIWDMNRQITSEWAQWKVDGQVAGFKVGFKGFTFATVHGAGHMVPQTRPAQALYMFEQYLSGAW